MKEATPTPAFRIPDGWMLEALPYSAHQMLLSTPPPGGMVTIDFQLRGFRGGCSSTGGFVGEKRTKRGGSARKAYEGRGWKQVLVDDAVAWLEEVQR